MREHFWLPPAKEFTHAPVTDEQIAAAEQALGVSLPRSYIEIIRVQNGGYLRYDTHPSPEPTNWSQDHVLVDHIMGIGPFNSILDTPAMRAQYSLPEAVVPICSHGHYWVCLDYRESGPQGEPTVVWIDIGAHHEVALAPDFATFVQGLVHGYHCHVYGIKGAGSDPAALIGNINRIFGVQLKKGMTDSYFAYHNDWRALDEHSRATFLLTENRYQNGCLRYPLNDQCQWLLICNISKANGEVAEILLSQSLPCEFEVIHIPPWEK